MRRDLTDRQRDLLRTIAEIEPEGWGEAYTFFDSKKRQPTSLEMRNFDATADALKRRGLIVEDDAGIRITDAGRAFLKDRP